VDCGATWRGESTVIQVQKATFIPSSEGATLRATLAIGEQAVTMTLPVTGDDQTLQSALDCLALAVQKVTVRLTDTGGEIAITMLVGEQAYVTLLPLDGEQAELRAALDRLTAALECE
jgi:hypothetical protein